MPNDWHVCRRTPLSCTQVPWSAAWRSPPRSPTRPGAPSPNRLPTVSACAWPSSICFSVGPEKVRPPRPGATVPTRRPQNLFSKRKHHSAMPVHTPSPCLVRGARPPGGAPVHLLLRHGTIVGVAPDIDAPEEVQTLDADGLIALPGLVDLHTHLREPGREDAETVLTGSRS